MKPKNFAEFNLNSDFILVLHELGFKEATPIQSASIPAILDGNDFIGQSETGSGKTAAFLIPILQKIVLEDKLPQALILCPTRELCEQVFQEAKKLMRAFRGVTAVSLIGGQPYPPQIQALQRGAQILVGTPGRTLEHLKNENFNAQKLRFLILDEADRMLEEGFADEMTAIMDMMPIDRQTIFFSATFPKSIEELSESYQKNPIHIQVGTEQKIVPSQIEQYIYEAEELQKIETLLKVLKRHPSLCTLIFCRTKARVAEIGKILSNFKVSFDVLHGDLSQAERDRAITLFRNGSLRILVATDVAARGLDIDNLELVINFDMPSTSDVYIHRIGRTGRAGRTGAAVTLSTAYESSKILEIEKITGMKMIRQKLGFQNQHGLGHEFQMTRTKTIQISGGKTDKIRAGDILGSLTAAPNPILPTEIGKIGIYDRYSYIAINTIFAEKVLQKINTVKIKGRKFKAFIL